MKKDIFDLKVSKKKLKFPKFLTSHTKKNGKKFIAKPKTLKRMDSKILHTWGKPKPMPKKNMTWSQAKLRYPKLKFFGDADRDGVKNYLDCRPFNKKKQGWKHEYSFSLADNPHITTVRMSPNTYVRKVWEQGGRTPVYQKKNAPQRKVSLEKYKQQIRELDKDTIDYLKKKIKSKKEKVAIGFLTMRGGKVTGQEGRHTALAAEELNIKKIPVTIETADKEDVEGYEKVRPTLQVEHHQSGGWKRRARRTGHLVSPDYDAEGLKHLDRGVKEKFEKQEERDLDKWADEEWERKEKARTEKEFIESINPEEEKTEEKEEDN